MQTHSSILKEHVPMTRACNDLEVLGLSTDSTSCFLLCKEFLRSFFVSCKEFLGSLEYVANRYQNIPPTGGRCQQEKQKQQQKTEKIGCVSAAGDLRAAKEEDEEVIAELAWLWWRWLVGYCTAGNFKVSIFIILDTLRLFCA